MAACATTSAAEAAQPTARAAAAGPSDVSAPSDVQHEDERKKRSGWRGAFFRASAATSDELRHPLLGDSPSLKLMPDRREIKGFAAARRDVQRAREPHWLMKLLGLAPKPLARTTPMRIEPKTFFANERTFLAWLHMAVIMGSVAAVLLGFASGTPAGEGSAVVARHLVQVIALILLPVAMFMVCYALYVFTWRANNIAQKRAVHVDDRYGPLWLCSLVVLALSSIFIICCIDYYEVMHIMDP